MLQQLLGTETYQAFITQYFFAMVGVVISLLLHGANRVVDEPSTPQKFSFWFLIKDNWKRVLLNLLIIYVTIRFFTELTGFELSLFWCLVIGVGYDQLVKLFKNKTNILDVTRKP